MSRTFFIPGVRVMQRDTAPSPPPRHPRAEAFYAEREKRRGSNQFVSGFTAGDQVDWKGQPGVVEHVEFDHHSGTERIYSRGEKTGTFLTEWKKQRDGDAIITNAKRTRE